MPKSAAVLNKESTSQISGLCKSISLVLAACLAFLVPFDISRNIDLQGLILIISGGFAWTSILLDHRSLLASLDRISKVLLAVFAASCLASLIANPHLGYDFFGAPYIRLGAGGLWACIGIGLLCLSVPRRRLLSGLYLYIVGLALVAIPYSLWHLRSLSRIGGVFAQADIFGCFLGCGLIIGWTMYSMYPERRRVIAGLQVFMAGLLLATQTRAVVLLVAVVGLLWIIRQGSDKLFKRLAVWAVAILVVAVTLNQLVPDRLTNISYMEQSVNYRLTLQKYALQSTAQKPLWGYGPGNLADSLSCHHLIIKSLQTTCDEGYFFNSSHNIFIDRILAVGWLGGLAFLGLVGLAIYRSFHGKKDQQVWGYTLMLVSFYYLTNVTSVVLELLLWILIFQCLTLVSKLRE